MSNYESSEEIREDIKETRRDMSRKIDAIQDHLSPDNLKAQAREVINEFATATADTITEYVRSNTREIGYTLADTIKRNPVPATLVGLGLGWMAVESFSSDRDSHVQYPLTKYERTPTYTYRGGYGQSGPSTLRTHDDNRHEQDQSLTAKVGETVSNAAHAVQSKVQEWGSQVRERVSDTANEAQWRAQRMRDEARLQSHLAAMNAQDQLSEWQGQGRSYAQQTGDSAQRYVGQATDYAGQTAETTRAYTQETLGQIGSYAQQASEQVRHYTQEAGSQVQETIEENPLIFGVIALAAGTAIGLMLPQTRSENRWIGPIRDQVADTTQAAASDVMHHAQEAVEEIRPELERTAQKVASDLQQTGQTIADDLKRAGETAVQETQNVAHRAQEVAKQKSQEAQDDVKQRVGEGREKVQSTA